MINWHHLLATFIAILVLSIAIIGCNSDQEQTEAEHAKEVNKWHQVRIDNLLGPEDWLKLAGLYELENGTHSFGSDSTNDFVFPPKATPSIGTIIKKDTTITVQVDDDVVVTHEQDTISEITMIPGNARSGTVLKHGSFVWYLLDRRGDYYIRLVDEQHPNLAAFDGIDRFSIDKKWKVEAEFKPFKKPKPITVPDILNEGMQDTLYGMLQFSINGEKYSLAPLNHPDKDDKFFIIFGDKTNGESTYGGGRYIYIPTPNEDNITYIDFNKSYNPPCVFTEYATCPLPPAQNKLDIAIPAGEKMFKDAQTY
ncbi:hypothetical protein CK503_00380 [Aliifodinibius salipaludis]|uniref:DUF1684 domain-containing protein n=1 Tax=Fodinibius salipaludis TaxID=2032627 RepID=A0A2A2GF44_9BACT|nr:DUF1684 domain-containing protein [Aliifodinibius salipaludis]PAU95557.1 hypothetical protein CK503_00380 [Aliifodinibius salipaludis]